MTTERLALLVDLGRVLGSSLDYVQAVKELAGALVPAVADLCLVVVMDEPGGPRRVALAGSDAESTALLESVREAPIDSRIRAVAELAMRSGRAQLISDYVSYVTPDNPDRPDHVALARLAPSATIVAPLVVRGAAFGVITLAMVRRSGRRFEDADLRFAEELGQRIGLAIDNARVHTQLRLREGQLALALEVAPVRLFSQDAQLRYTLIQGGGRVPAEHALGKTDRDLFAPADAEPIIALKRRVLETGLGARGIVHVTGPSGLLHYDQTIEPVRDAAGHVVGITGASWDVTEQWRLIEQREVAEARTRQLIEDAPEPYILVEPDGRIVDVNAAFSALLDYTRDELLGMAEVDLVVAEAAAAERPPREPGTIVVAEWQLRHKRGASVDVEMNAKVLPGGRRQGFARDIRDRKRAERDRERMLELEQQHRARLQLLREATLVISAFDEHSSGLQSVLQRVVDQARLLACADYAAIGIGTDPDRPFAPWVWSGMSAEVAAAIGASPRARGVLGWVAQHDEPLRVSRLHDHHASGGVPPGHPPMDAFLGVPVRRDGRAIGNLYLARSPGRDAFVEEDQAMVELLAGHAAIAIENARLYDERQTAVRAREDVIAIVSHDLKNPLNSIALRELQLSRTQSDPKLLAHERSVRQSVAMMQRIVRGLLDASSLDLGQLRLAVGAYDLRELVGEVVDVLAPIANDRGVRIDVRIPALPPQRFDRERILQTVYNLTGNAVKFTPAGGEVVITAELHDHELQVSVVDPGPGIAPEALPRIFERYFTTATGHEGTGLGLYIAKGVVEAHGGRIWGESTLGEGTAFHFALPAAG